MITFVLASVLLAAITLAILTRPWWQAPAPQAVTAEPMNQTLQQLREQIQQLDTLRDSGALGAEAHATARAALERKLVDQVVNAGPAETVSPAPVVTSGKPLRSMALAGVLFAVVAGGGYWWLGTPAALTGASTGVAAAGSNPGDGPAANPNDPAAHQITAEQIAEMAERLAARLEKQPDDAVGWAMLGRSYAVTGQHEKAIPAFRKALALQKDDPVLLADFADALAMTQKGVISGEPLTLVTQALKVDPKNLKALSLAGTEAFGRKDYTGALKFWEKLRDVAPPDSVFVQQIVGGIEEARALAGLPPSPAAASAAKSGAAPAPMAAVLGQSVSGSVTLSPALAGKASPDDTVFIFARAANGPRMPLAILRHQVKDLPLKFTLDDSLAMSPAARLSAFPQVVIGARISKNGQAAPQAGDLQGLSAAVAVGSTDVKIEINQTVSP